LNTKTKLLAGGTTVVVLALIAGAAFWYFFDTDTPAAVSIEGAIEAAGSSGAVAPDDYDTAGTDAPLTGDWEVVQDGVSFAGYRIDQQVANVGRETVVGRTENVEGKLTFDGTSITQTEITVEMTGLRTDESLRDRVLRSEAIETASFPTSTFVLTQPVPVSSIPPEGQPVSQTVTGDLTLHGVTRPVEIDTQAVLRGGQLIVVGSEEIQLRDFGITPPRGPASVLSVEDHGVMELQLVFERAG
jgi:polyisoprenoid-binding protein YceI